MTVLRKVFLTGNSQYDRRGEWDYPSVTFGDSSPNKGSRRVGAALCYGYVTKGQNPLQLSFRFDKLPNVIRGYPCHAANGVMHRGRYQNL